MNDINPSAFNPDTSFGFSLYRTQIMYVTLMRRTIQAAGYDLTPEQLNLLGRLHQHAGITQTRLGELACKDRHNTTRILNLLEERGLVERRPDQADRRIYRLHLTKLGRQTYEELLPIIHAQFDKVFQDLDPTDLGTTRQTLERIFNNLEDLTK